MTAVFTWPVSYGTGEENDHGIKRIRMGDGYTQRRQDSINAIRGIWPIRTKRPLAEIGLIKQFLKTNGRTGFNWTPPGETVPVRVTCDGSKITHPSFDMAELTATFIQEFEP